MPEFDNYITGDGFSSSSVLINSPTAVDDDIVVVKNAHYTTINIEIRLGSKYIGGKYILQYQTRVVQYDLFRRLVPYYNPTDGGREKIRQARVGDAMQVYRTSRVKIIIAGIRRGKKRRSRRSRRCKWRARRVHAYVIRQNNIYRSITRYLRDHQSRTSSNILL